MATAIEGSWRWLPGEIDADGHRTWKVKITTRGDYRNDGPAAHSLTPGLPIPGNIYTACGFGNDRDDFAWCHGGRTISPREDAGTIFFDHEYTFGTRPADKDPNRRDDKGSRRKCA